MNIEEPRSSAVKRSKKLRKREENSSYKTGLRQRLQDATQCVEIVKRESNVKERNKKPTISTLLMQLSSSYK